METAVAGTEKRQLQVSLSTDVLDVIQARASDLRVPLDVYLESVLRSGIQAEEGKRQALFAKLETLRQTSGEKEAGQLENEIGVMIFGK